MNMFVNSKSCVQEINFVESIQTGDYGNSLFYAFTSHRGRIAAEFSASLDHGINRSMNKNISKMLLFHTNNGQQPWGLISADVLHKTCGPYPEIEPNIIDSFDFVVRTFLLPILTMLVLVTNACVCMVFSRRHMINPVFLILLVIGLMELANSLLPLPFYLAQSWFQRRNWWESLPRLNFTYQEHLLKRTCWTLGPPGIYQTSSNTLASRTSAWTTVFLPTITHTCSVWLTITLALQRLIYVSRPNDTSKMCTLNKSILISLIILLGSFVIHIPLLCSQFLEFRPIRLRTEFVGFYTQNITSNHVCLTEILLDLPVIVMKCHNLQPKYMLAYFYARIILIHLMPCGILAILTSLLVWKMRQITQLRKRLNANSSKQVIPIRSLACLEICINRLRLDSSSYINGSTNKICKKSNTKRNDNLRTQVTKISKRKQNSIGNPQAISRMLIVVLIKFIAMHLPNAIALLVYVFITLEKRESSKEYASHSEEPLNQSLIIGMPLNHPTSPASHSSANSTRTVPISEPNHWARLSTMCNLIILVSYQLNVFIYYTMSSAFRETFEQICGIQFNCGSCMKYSTKHSASHPTSLPEDTNQSNHTINQTESGENDKNLIHHAQIGERIPIFVEPEIDRLH